MSKHGQKEVQDALEQALAAEQIQLLGLARFLREPLPQQVEVPDSLADYVVESAQASDYELLLFGGEL